MLPKKRTTRRVNFLVKGVLFYVFILLVLFIEGGFIELARAADDVSLPGISWSYGITQRADIREYFYQLWHASGFGFNRFERAAFLTYDRTGFGLQVWGAISNHIAEQIFVGDIPDSVIALPHTHPNGTDPRPSQGDIAVAKQNDIIIYVLSRDGVWSYNPRTDRIIHEEDESYWRSIQSELDMHSRKNDGKPFKAKGNSSVLPYEEEFYSIKLKNILRSIKSLPESLSRRNEVKTE